MVDAIVAGQSAGGREDVLARLGAESPEIGGVHLSATNLGAMGIYGVSEGLAPQDPDELASFAQERNAVVVVGPEQMLVDGVASRLRANGVDVFGPDEQAAQLEGSKAYATQFMRRHGIPHPKSTIVTGMQEGLTLLDAHPANGLVLKADGLAGGKGVVLPKNRGEYEKTLDGMLDGSLFGKAGETVVIQERLSGPEVSVFIVSDGERFSVVPYGSQDHKRLADGDEGPNTGGMGAYAPVPDSILPADFWNQVDDIAERAITGSRADGHPYNGVLYAGLMIVDGKVNVIEFNDRWGDPEAQVVLPMIQKSGVDVYGDLLLPAARGELRPDDIRWRETGHAALTVCLAAEGYPANPQKGAQIHGLDKSYRGVTVYHGGTKLNEEGQPVVNGGRVLYATGQGEDIDEAAARAYAAIGENGVHFDGMQYRRDIGWQARGTGQ